MVIRINHRQLLYGIAVEAGIESQWVDMTMAIDKLDKVGEEGVRKELAERGISKEAQDKIFSMFNNADIKSLRSQFAEGSQGAASLDDMEQVFTYLAKTSLKNKIEFDITLARGIGYYTGCIFEVTGIDADMGSLGGGGRYDNLTGVFGWPDVPGVGISFGAERIYDVLEAKNLFPSDVHAGPKIILAAFDEASHQYAFQCVSKIRQAGIPSDLYPEYGKLKKQIDYASKIGCTYVGIAGGDEMQKGTLMLKNIVSGEQSEKTIEEVVAFLSK